MSEQQPLVLDLARKEDVLQVFPRPPLRSSENLGWDGIEVQQHCQPAWESPECAHPTHILAVAFNSDVVQSERWFDGHRQQEQIGQENNIAIIPAMVQHRGTWDREVYFSVLSLDPDRLVQMAYESITTDCVELIPQHTMQDPFIDWIGKSLTQEVIADQFSSRLFVDALTEALSIHLLRHYSDWHKPLRDDTGGLPRRQLRQAIAYIHDHLAADLTIGAIADEVGMSHYYFSRLFKQSMGVSPYRYVMGQRVEAAKTLLKQTPLSIAAIAAQTGFTSQNQLTIQFRNFTGTTPIKYRQQL